MILDWIPGYREHAILPEDDCTGLRHATTIRQYGETVPCAYGAGRLCTRRSIDTVIQYAGRSPPKLTNGPSGQSESVSHLSMHFPDSNPSGAGCVVIRSEHRKPTQKSSGPLRPPLSPHSVVFGASVLKFPCFFPTTPLCVELPSALFLARVGPLLERVRGRSGGRPAPSRAHRHANCCSSLLRGRHNGEPAQDSRGAAVEGVAEGAEGVHGRHAEVLPRVAVTPRAGDHRAQRPGAAHCDSQQVHPGYLHER